MKAKIKRTGEIVDVWKNKHDIYITQDHRAYACDELEFIDMVSLDKICEYLRSLYYQNFSGGPMIRVMDETDIERLRKHFE